MSYEEQLNPFGCYSAKDSQLCIDLSIPPKYGLSEQRRIPDFLCDLPLNEDSKTWRHMQPRRDMNK
jgi:hypothetical protein